MKLRLLTKLILCILLPAVCGLSLLAFWGGTMAKKGMLEQIDNDLTLVALVQARELDNILSMLQNVVVAISRDGAIDAYYSARDQGLPLLHVEESAQQSLNNIRNTFKRIRDIGLINSSGTVLVHTAKGFAGQSLADRVYFKESMQGKASKVTVLSRATNSYTYILSAPVTVNKLVVGVAYLTVDIASLAQSTTDNLKVGKTGYAFVLDAAGTILIHPQKDSVGKKVRDQDWGKAMLGAPKGTVDTIINNVEYKGFFDNVSATGWKVGIFAQADDLLEPVNNMMRTTVAITLGIIVVVGGIILLMARNMAAVLRGSANIAEHVAGGNLVLSDAQRNELTRNSRRSDEMGELSKALDTMIQSIARLFGQSEEKTQEAQQAKLKAEEAVSQAQKATLKAESARSEGMLAAADQLAGAVEVIMSAADQLSAQIEQSERGASEQAVRATSTATAMAQMNATVLEVARNAGSASDMSTQTRQRAELGATVVHKAVDSIQAVQQQSAQLHHDMGTLDERARAISQIMSVISDIADQTNLLALNAAIEAARAGDAGRGFAVVADEVRKLAEKTMQSTGDVATAIKAIQESASTSLNQVEHAGKTIGEATNFAEQSGTALTEIVSMMDQAADQVRAIATAAEEQSATSEEINAAIGEVNAIAAETSDTMRQAAQAVEELSKQAHVLNGLIAEMRKA